MFKSDSWAMFGGIKNRILTQASFSSRLGEAVLLGNAHLEDEEINLNGFGFDYWQYQQLQFGLIKTKKVKNVWMNFGAALSFVNGNNWMNFQNQNGYLYTAPDGEYVEAKLNGEFRQSNENNSGFFANNGYGASLDLFLEGKTSDIKFFISAQDIGGIAFQKNARTYAFDTTIVFQGLEFESVTNIGENYFDILNDSLQNIIQGVKRSANHFAFLPTQISGGISTDLTTKTSAHFFVNYRLGGHYSPQFVFRMQWKTLPKLNLGFNALLGGYHTTGLGADIAYNIGSGYVVSGGMRSFLGFIAPNTSTGISGFFSFVKYFGK
jgi:hypothetical protein